MIILKSRRIKMKKAWFGTGWATEDKQVNYWGFPEVGSGSSKPWSLINPSFMAEWKTEEGLINGWIFLVKYLMIHSALGYHCPFTLSLKGLFDLTIKGISSGK